MSNENEPLKKIYAELVLARIAPKAQLDVPSIETEKKDGEELPVYLQEVLRDLGKANTTFDGRFIRDLKIWGQDMPFSDRGAKSLGEIRLMPAWYKGNSKLKETINNSKRNRVGNLRVGNLYDAMKKL